MLLFLLQSVSMALEKLNEPNDELRLQELQQNQITLIHYNFLIEHSLKSN